MHNTWKLTALASAIACAACSTAPTQPSTLAGTTWRLESIQSMDDAQGTTRPAPDRRYTVRFTPEGAAEFQLDCNRGRTSYTLSATEPGRGQLSFGNVAMTRAMCPAPALDARIARDMGAVRSYTLQGQTLSMSLMADGGIYTWVRESAP